MASKILLALDNSKYSLKAVKYAVKTLKPDSMVTMLTVLPDPTAACGLDGPSLMEGFMEEAKKRFVAAGFSPKNIAIRIRKKKTGISRDILKEAKRGKYDTILMGRRGLTGIKQFVAGSITNKMRISLSLS
ncbi:MAG: universal stress protein [Deltaproteobacteria bacterium]|nr:universal stress protein [Deltaproteobacteria bacterium]